MSSIAVCVGGVVILSDSSVDFQDLLGELCLFLNADYSFVFIREVQFQMLHVDLHDLVEFGVRRAKNKAAGTGFDWNERHLNS